MDRSFIVFYFDETVRLPLAPLLPGLGSLLSSRSGEGDGRGFGLELAGDEVGSPLGWGY